jgi:hypothetical protein
VLTSEAAGTELQLEHVCLENGPAKESGLVVFKSTGASIDGDKQLSTGEEISSTVTTPQFSPELGGTEYQRSGSQNNQKKVGPKK